MAKTAKDYGTRTKVARFANKDSDYSELPSTFPVPNQIYTGDSNIDGYILLDDTGIKSDTPSLHASRCFCAECQKTFQTDINIDCNPNKNRLVVNSGRSYVGDHSVKDVVSSRKILHYSASDDIDMPMKLSGSTTCTECGKELKNVAMIQKHAPKGADQEQFDPFCFRNETQPTMDKPGSNPFETNGRWCLPPHFMCRQLYASRDDAGNLTRVEDQMLFRRTTIDPNGDVHLHGTEIMETSDLLNHTRMITESVIRNKTRNTYQVTPVLDPFRSNPQYKTKPNSIRYFDNAPTFANKLDRLDILNPEAGNVPFYQITEDGSMEPMTRPAHVDYNGIYRSTSSDRGDRFHDIFCEEDPEEPIKTGNYFTDAKAKLIERVFAEKASTQDPIMADSAKTGVYLSEHHPDSNEANTNTDPKLKDKIITMMVQYPAAFDYALERAHNHVVDYEMGQKRKEKAAEETGGSYHAKTMTDKGKARFMRQELTYVAEQLSTMDNKLLRIVHDSPNISALKANMASVAFGDQWASIKSVKGKERDLIEGGKFRIDTDHAMGDPVRSTKALINKFNADMFGVTNTIYTCHKIGITNIDHVNAFVAAGQNAPDVQSKTVMHKGRQVEGRTRKPNVNAGMIKPIESKEELRLMRLFANTHSPQDVLEIYTDADKFQLYSECIDLYRGITDKKARIITSDDPKTAQYDRDIRKNNLRSYLQFHSVEEAYIDHVTMYGANTPTAINELIGEIQLDKKMPEIQAFAKANGVQAAVTQFADDFAKTGSAVKNDPAGYIQTYSDQDALAGQQIVMTRNGKDLFRGRSMREIHDEMSHMNQHLVSENTSLQDVYPKAVRDMERSYDCPDGDGQWSFHCHQDSFDVVRSATQLHNCLGSSYVDKMLRKQSYVLYMQDETGQRVAAIEIAKKSSYDENSPYEVLQFQADHDTALPARYAGVAKQWLKDSGIDYQNNSNVAAFGRTRENGSAYAFYGDNADFHHQEVDDTTGTLVQKDRLERRQQERIQRAKELFHYDETTDSYQFGVEVPDYKP